MFGTASELLAKLGVLGCDSDRTGIEVTFAHHDAPHRNQGGCGKSKLLCPKYRGYRYVPARLYLPVRLQYHTGSKIVHNESLMGLRNA